MRERLERIGGLLLIPLLWWTAIDLCALANPVLVPPLGKVLARLGSILSNGLLAADLACTGYRWALGFSFGVLFGILAGLLLGVSTRLRRLFEFPLEFTRSLPVTALFPLFLILFGIGDPSKVAMAFFPTFLLMTVNTCYGVVLSDPTRCRMAEVFGASRTQIFTRIVAMDALPQIFVGLRLALAQSLIVTVVSEMFIGTDFGLGQRVYDSYLTNSVTTLYALLIVLGTVGYAASRALMMIESRVVFWTGK